MPSAPGSNRETASVGDDEVVMSLVERALQQPPELREQFVREACAGDASLVETVWQYVKWDARMKDFLLYPIYPLPAEEAVLEPGQMLDTRFRIVRKIAGGGMGVVYEAQDEKLGRRIAIKCARAGFGARLSPEVLHASEINHPNVCKTWEIHTASGPHGSFDFLTMEFIDGQTLAEKLREGPLGKNEARTIATQLCAGLAEAHRHGVIHGDLKPNNILLARAADGSARVVITDFGLARALSAHDPAVMSVEPGGTVHYMAPELLKCQRPTPASDVYALGVILHELACGRKPFETDLPIEERLTRQPAMLKRPWGRIIARCLEPNPALRCSTVSEVSAALVPFPLLRWSAIAATVLIAAVLGAIGYRMVGVTRESVRLAILPFVTESDSRSLSDGLLQETADRLRRVKDDRRKFIVIPARDAARNRIDASEKAAARLGATHVLTGRLHRENHGIRVSAVLTDARSNLKLKEWEAEYPNRLLADFPVALSGLVTGTLRLKPIAAAVTVNAVAYPDFAAGLGLLQQGDSGVDAAIPLLARAASADPDSPLTHARLAEAEVRKYHLGLDSVWLEKARQSLREAEQRNPDLGLVWLVSARINEYGGFYEAAESDLARALQLDPRDGDSWRRLGQDYQESYRFDEAAVAFEKAIEFQPEEFFNYIDLCALYTEQGDYAAAIPQCRKTVQLAPDSLDAHFALAVSYFKGGLYAESEPEFLLAMKLDPSSEKAVYGWAFALTSRGRGKEGIPLFQRAVEMGPATHLVYSGLGTAYRLTGAPAKAKDAYREGLRLAEKGLEKNPRNAILKAQLAYLCAQLGQDSRARSEAIQARQLAPGSMEVAWWLVLTWETLGDRDQALAMLQTVPDDMIRRLSRETDLAEFRQSARFQQLKASRHIE
jgi:eukaryotic-like serine/threonine-protein kinase